MLPNDPRSRGVDVLQLTILDLLGAFAFAPDGGVEALHVAILTFVAI